MSPFQQHRIQKKMYCQVDECANFVHVEPNWCKDTNPNLCDINTYDITTHPFCIDHWMQWCHGNSHKLVKREAHWAKTTFVCEQCDQRKCAGCCIWVCGKLICNTCDEIEMDYNYFWRVVNGTYDHVKCFKCEQTSQNNIIRCERCSEWFCDDCMIDPAEYNYDRNPRDWSVRMCSACLIRQNHHHP